MATVALVEVFLSVKTRLAPVCTASLNVAFTLLVTATLAAPVPGVVVVIVGRVVSGTAVVNDQLVLAIVFPAVSLAPLTVAVYVVLPASAADGVKVAVRVFAS